MNGELGGLRAKEMQPVETSYPSYFLAWWISALTVASSVSFFYLITSGSAEQREAKEVVNEVKKRGEKVTREADFMSDESRSCVTGWPFTPITRSLWSLVLFFHSPSVHYAPS